MADLITWSPRVGSSGDDRYSVPDDTPVRAGSSSFSSPPTMAEINAAADINQIAAEINRRRFTDQQLMFSVPAMSYVAAGDRIAPTYLATTLRNAINLIRANDEQSAYSWTAGLSANSPLRKAHIFDLRKALATEVLRIYPASAYWPSNCVERVGVTHPTYPTTRVRTTNTHSLYMGKRSNYYTSPETIRFRSYLHFQIPTDVQPGVVSAKLCLHANYSAGWASFNWEVWRSNTFLGPTDAGDYDLGLDNHVATVTTSGSSSDTPLEIDVGIGGLTLGGTVTYVLVTTVERTGAYVQGTNEDLLVIGPLTDDAFQKAIYLKLE